jgi:hypothetical protein
MKNNIKITEDEILSLIDRISVTFTEFRHSGYYSQNLR